MNKDVRKLVAALQRIDGVEVITGGSHLKVHKAGQFVTTIPTTPSDVRWRSNTLADLRRHGITPASSEEKLSRPPRTIPVETLRGHLAGLRERRQMATFARFTQQLGEVRGLRVYANVASCESSIQAIANGTTAKPTAWAWKLLSASWEEWATWVSRAEAEAEEAVEEAEPEAPVEVVVGGPTLVIDLKSIVQALARLGIRAEVR